MEESIEHLKGFNHAFMLMKNEPELAKQMARAYEGKKSEYIQGFVECVQDYQINVRRVIIHFVKQQQSNTPNQANEAVVKQQPKKKKRGFSF